MSSWDLGNPALLNTLASWFMRAKSWQHDARRDVACARCRKKMISIAVEHEMLGRPYCKVKQNARWPIDTRRRAGWHWPWP